MNPVLDILMAIGIFLGLLLAISLLFPLIVMLLFKYMQLMLDYIGWLAAKMGIP